ncbi:MAG TPA: hypothetical protein VHE30_11270 [Polyangiaceae bacterium]|nr:hypothetical protein [Polyangiaceae bacterium]
MATAERPIPKRPPPPPVDMKPILGGRLWTAVFLLAGLGLIANPAFNETVKRHAPPEDIRTDFSKWKEGATAQVRVTVITADAARLSCANADVVEGLHCGYGSDRILWPKGPNEPADDNQPNLIQPYRTSPDNALILLAGLWAQPEVAMRLHREPPSGVSAKRLNRFDVVCDVKFLKKWEKVDVRWDVTGNWVTERNALPRIPLFVARATSCSVVKS